MIALCLYMSLCLAAAGDEGVITVGSQKQLFLDDYLIASTTNVTRRVQLAEKFKGNPVLWRNEPWEDPFNVVYGSVIRDGDKYRMWYKSGAGVSYAESDDGVAWVKPQLDLVMIDGRKTNILFRKSTETSGSDELPYYQELFGVYKDPREADPARRYKMGYLSIDWNYTGPRPTPFRQRRGLGVAGSPDGLHWKLIENWATEAICDGGTHWFFDPARERYMLFGRTEKTLPEVEAAWSKQDWYGEWHSGRAVARVESPDFVKWDFTDPLTAPVVMTADLQDPPGTEIYSMEVFPYEGVYIGFVQVFHALSDNPYLDVQLAVSRDGERFTRVAERTPFLTVGSIGSWDRFNQSLASNPPIAVGDELRIYYGGRTYRHAPYRGKDTGPRAGGIGFASIQRDRFVSLEASFDGGEVVTKPLRLAAKTMHLNARSDFGEIIVEVLDLTGKTVDRSKPICIDSLDTVPHWGEGGPEKATGPVFLRITLKNACLYSLWCS